MPLMTYDEAKVAECLKSGVGAHFGEIKKILKWNSDRVIRGLVGLARHDWADLRLVDKQAQFFLTEKGQQAYAKWAELPF